MRNAVLLLIAFFLLPSIAVANPVAQRAATTLTNRVMKMLEPQIAEITEKAPIPPTRKMN